MAAYWPATVSLSGHGKCQLSALSRGHGIGLLALLAHLQVLGQDIYQGIAIDP